MGTGRPGGEKGRPGKAPQRGRSLSFPILLRVREPHLPRRRKNIK